MHQPLTKRINNFITSFSNLNGLILVIVIALCLIGMLAVYSASLNMEGSFFKKAFGRQMIWLLLGGLLTAAIYFIQKKLMESEKANSEQSEGAKSCPLTSKMSREGRLPKIQRVLRD